MGDQFTEREERLGEVVFSYLAALESGSAPSRDTLLATYPEFGPELVEFFAEREKLDRVAAPLRGLARRPGEALGDYRILREVGRGGMGVVYEAEQISLGRRVALKVLPFTSTADARQLKRFHNEARAAASLEHPNIVTVYSVGCERGIHYYAMQFIDGRSLAEWVAGEPVVDAQHFRRVATWGAQAAEALAYAHSLSVIHRDVKPANLLIDHDGRLWVTDFGLALTAADAGVTMSGDLVGTLRYMSPEQALGSKGAVDLRCDVYSLGATLYELLTLRPAIEGQDRQEVLHRLADVEPKAPSALVRSLPRDLETVVLKAMAKDARERYSSAEELGADLRRFLEGRPVVARRPGPLQHAYRWAARHQAVVAAGIVSLLVGVAALAISTVLIASAHRNAVQHQQEAERRERDLRVLLYPAEVGAAYRAWQGGNPAQARELLARHVPAEGEEDARGFEWYYLWDQCRPVESRTLLTLGKDVESIAFSPDGKQLAAGGISEVYLLDVATGRTLASWQVEGQRINCLSFSADGSKLASTSLNGTMWIHDTRTRQRTVIWPREKGHCLGGVYVSDGSITARIHREGIHELWNVLTNRRRDFPAGWRFGRVSAGRVSGDGKRLALGEADGRVSVWGLDEKPEAGPLRLVHSAVVAGTVEELAFTPDRDCLAAVTNVGTVHLFSLDTFKPSVPLIGQEAVLMLAASPDGLTLASGGYDRTIRLWDLPTRRQRAVIPNGASIACLAFSPCGRWLASGDEGEVRLYRLPDRRATVRLRPAPSGGRHTRVSPNGQHLVSTDSVHSPIRLWDLATGRLRAPEIPKSRHSPAPFSFSPDSKTFASSTTEAVGLWDMETGRLRVRLPGGRCAAFSPDGRTVVTGGADGALLEWDAESGQRRGKLGEAPFAVTSLAWSGDGRTLASGHADGRVWRWDRAEGRRSELSSRHRAEVGFLAFSPDSLTLVSAGGKDALIYLEPVDGSALRRSITVQSYAVIDLGLSPDGRTLAVAGQGQVALFHVATGQPLFALERLATSWPSVNFAADGQSLLTGVAEGGELIVWHAPRGGAD